MRIHLREPARRIDYRTAARAPFGSTGEDHGARDPDTLEPLARTTFLLPEDARATTVEVRYVDLAGAVKGPFRLRFDPVTEAIHEAKSRLETSQRRWIGARHLGNKREVEFWRILSNKLALRAVHYGIDTRAPDRTLAFTQNATGRIDDGDETRLTIPERAKTIVIQLEYRDGTRSRVRTFTLEDGDATSVIIKGRPIL